MLPGLFNPYRRFLVPSIEQVRIDETPLYCTTTLVSLINEPGGLIGLLSI